MKELSIEQKARAYDEALEKAKKNYDVAQNLCNGSQIGVECFKNTLTNIFPELKESKENEDEKIRKAIMACCSDHGHKYQYTGITAQDMLHWLEKQSEKINPYSGTSFKYNGHIWGMCARDNGIEIVMDGKPIRHFSYKDCEQTFGGKSAMDLWRDMRFEVGAQASGNRHEPPMSDNDSKLFSLNDIDEIMEIITEKQGGKTYSGKSALEAAKEEKVDNQICIKPFEDIEPKFKVRDWCIDNEDDTKFQITKVLDNTYKYKTNEGKEYSCTHYSLENDARLWTIADAKDGDVLVNGSNIFIFHFINDTRLMGYCHVNIDNGRFYDDIGKNECFCLIDAIVTPATKEQRDLLFRKMKEAGYEWDAEKKEVKEIELKKLDADKVIAWLVANIYDFECYVKLFKKDFGL